MTSFSSYLTWSPETFKVFFFFCALNLILHFPYSSLSLLWLSNFTELFTRCFVSIINSRHLHTFYSYSDIIKQCLYHLLFYFTVWFQSGAFRVFIARWHKRISRIKSQCLCGHANPVNMTSRSSYLHFSVLQPTPLAAPTSEAQKTTSTL